ncbi:MAG: hypothetical protein ACTJLM_04780 [Ehrlichia sp.]
MPVPRKIRVLLLTSFSCIALIGVVYIATFVVMQLLDLVSNKRAPAVWLTVHLAALLLILSIGLITACLSCIYMRHKHNVKSGETDPDDHRYDVKSSEIDRCRGRGGECKYEEVVIDCDETLTEYSLVPLIHCLQMLKVVLHFSRLEKVEVYYRGSFTPRHVYGSTCCNTYLFLELKKSFDKVLDKINACYLPSGGPLADGVYDVLKLRSRLSEDDFVFAVLCARFIGYSGFLFHMYPESVFKMINALGGIPIPDVSVESCENACDKIIELLGQELYYVGDKYHQILKNIFCEHASGDCMSGLCVEGDFYKITSVDQQLEVLGKLFSMSALRYYSIYDIDICRVKIDLATRIIESLTGALNCYVDERVIVAAKGMVESGFAIQMPKAACRIQNAREIVDNFFGKTCVGYVVRDHLLCIEKDTQDPINTTFDLARGVIGHICDSYGVVDPVTKSPSESFVGRLLKASYGEEAYNALYSNQNDTVEDMPGFSRFFARSMNSVKIQVLGMQDRSLECYKEICRSIYEGYIRLDKMISNPTDFCREVSVDDMANQSQTRPYVLFTSFASSFGSGLIELYPTIDPVVPIDEQKILCLEKTVVESKLRNVVIMARIACCFPDLLNFYSEDVVNRIRELACLSLGSEIVKSDYTSCVEMLCARLLVLESKDKLNQPLTHLYGQCCRIFKEAEVLRATDEGQLYCNSGEIMLSGLRYTCFYSGQATNDRAIIDSAFQNQVNNNSTIEMSPKSYYSLHINRRCLGYCILMKFVFEGFGYGYDLCFPMFHVLIGPKAVQQSTDQQEREEAVLPIQLQSYVVDIIDLSMKGYSSVPS